MEVETAGAGADGLGRELSRLRDLVLAVGSWLREQEGHLARVDRKGATELITDLDRESERRLVAGLAEAFPGDGVVAEEGGGGEGRSGRTWYVDPLDGTTNYVHGYPFYCVSAGCARGDELLLAAVHAPALDELYLAAAGAGAFLERPVAGGGGRRLPGREPVALADALLATGFPYVRQDGTLERVLEQARRFLAAGCHGVRRGGSAAVDLCHVAAGRLDGYWELRLRPWDVAAGTLVAREAGAVVTDHAGGGGRLDGASILAAAPGLHAEMLRRLQEGP